MNRWRWGVGVLSLLWLSSCTSEDGPSIAGQDVQLTMLHTTDVHSRLVPYDLQIGEIDSRLRRNELRRQDVELAHAPRERLEATDALVEKVEAQGELVRLVLELDEAYREVVLLRYFEGLELAEIAARRREPLATVRSRHTRALAVRAAVAAARAEDPDPAAVLAAGPAAPSK